MKIRKIALIATALILSSQIFAQDNKFGIWYGADASKKIAKGLKAEVAGALRTDENGSNIESFYFEGGLNYKFNKFISAGAYYRCIEQKENDGDFYFRHRFYADLKGTVPMGRFTLSARYRFQEQKKTYIKSVDDEDATFYNRFKFELDYNIPRIPLTPSAFVEFSGQAMTSNDIMIEKRRVGGGLKYSITRKQSVSLDYIYLSSKVSNPAYFNVLSLNYSVKF
ncbi:MAG TPA: DUF2490 domain-containing protein [Bacteroidales bacterium]|nr:DUF2490 domain-containing protein [Bacteroidales bacterium]HPT22074.1 DUF2490 domain-containing protein [Bacteroidales bacterium]